MHWILTNSAWIFSGIGVLVLSLVGRIWIDVEDAELEFID
jgi:hypothetical protein